jgi:hypothetical protein
VELKKVATGEVKIIKDDFYRDINDEEDEDGWTSRQGVTYIWEDGNFACDCNRRDFFEDDGNENEPQCGHGAYELIQIHWEEPSEPENSNENK